MRLDGGQRTERAGLGPRDHDLVAFGDPIGLRLVHSVEDLALGAPSAAVPITPAHKRKSVRYAKVLEFVEAAAGNLLGEEFDRRVARDLVGAERGAVPLGGQAFGSDYFEKFGDPAARQDPAQLDRGRNTVSH
ncbi:hypothetical protein KRR38_01725 [Novosphingobium sp. G106]|uniref:hypothetical protein n=1 Tax=Novosphingobium sp. G106 TaxID=2849500 RepID=UPI001C2D0D38|nr:hypothetical protein [Novosphingobium sp. G106]MBV1686423.1 hypothetical protein [Novosphingobium sp. G106]